MFYSKSWVHGYKTFFPDRKILLVVDEAAALLGKYELVDEKLVDEKLAERKLSSKFHTFRQALRTIKSDSVLILA